jgi:hypothetical protein
VVPFPAITTDPVINTASSSISAGTDLLAEASRATVVDESNDHIGRLAYWTSAPSTSTSTSTSGPGVNHATVDGAGSSDEGNGRGKK